MSSSLKKAPFFEVLNNLGEGDVVLFKTERTMSKLQRFVCNSEYDHVGLVVIWDDCDTTCCSKRLKRARRKAGTPAYHTLEADSENGVQLHRLTPACLKAYDGSVYIRHLDLSAMSDAQVALAMAALHSFVDAVLGAPYERSMTKIIRAANFFGDLNKTKSKGLGGPAQSCPPSIASSKLSSSSGGTISPSRKTQLLLNPFEMRRLPLQELPSVFCSELVAAAYIVMGILPRNGRDPGLYIPRDFSVRAEEHRKLDFVGDVSLGRELEIDCSDLRLAPPAESLVKSTSCCALTLSSSGSESIGDESSGDEAEYLKRGGLMFSSFSANGGAPLTKSVSMSAGCFRSLEDQSRGKSGVSTPSVPVSSGCSTPFDESEAPRSPVRSATRKKLGCLEPPGFCPFQQVAMAQQKRRQTMSVKTPMTFFL